MKKFLCIILLASLAMPIIAYTQAYQTPIDDPINHLTNQEWGGISFNGVSLDTLETTKGDQHIMNTLFQFTPQNSLGLSEKEDPISRRRELMNHDIIFSYDDLNFGTDYSLVRITVRSKNIKVTVKGKTARIGDHYSKLGSSIKLNPLSDGGVDIAFDCNDVDATSFWFDIDKATGTITGINYEYFF